MSCRIDEAGHARPLITQSRSTGGKPKCSVPRVGLEPTTHRSGVERPPSEHKYVVYTYIYVVYLVEIRNSAT